MVGYCSGVAWMTFHTRTSIESENESARVKERDEGVQPQECTAPPASKTQLYSRCAILQTGDKKGLTETEPMYTI